MLHFLTPMIITPIAFTVVAKFNAFLLDPEMWNLDSIIVEPSFKDERFIEFHSLETA